MLSIYRDKIKPVDEVNYLISLTDGFPEKHIKKWQRLNYVNSEYVYVVLNGEFEYRRIYDDLCLFTARNPFMFGITSIFNDVGHVYGLARSELIVRMIKKSEFIALLTQANAWSQMTKILTWYLLVANKRDDILVARSAYDVIREFLLEINDLIILGQHKINIYDYIQEYTNLARSTIVKILSELKRGEYIEVDKGHLIKINSLPVKY
ncbi:helix-turn-helix domain-containing protein [Pluralibacter sp.]|uniref:helix-turn-helix domain-containing protein n=1 Tax=Pluralibacter sp. TaxID=1920032 RepID=UPI0025D7DE97|nr:helix-turn-helix domain-containing protein [Pluralibacter sp.]MBV8044371.1 helix-turn-helix domain-containing protein [Pluralibacter sp.]